MKAYLKNHKQSPRKVRLVADLVRGKRADHAIQALRFTNRKASSVILKLLESAIANAKQKEELEASNLFVKEITVDEGLKLKRFMPRAMGRATPILKRASHISIKLDKNI